MTSVGRLLGRLLRAVPWLVAYALAVVALTWAYLEIRQRRLPRAAFTRGETIRLAPPPRPAATSVQEQAWRPLGDLSAPAEQVFPVAAADGPLAYAVAQHRLFRLGPETRYVGGPFEGSLILDVKFALLPDRGHRIFAHTSRGLFASSDRGESWDDLSPESADPTLRAVAIAGDGRGELLAAAARSDVLVSSDGGRIWRSAARDLGAHAPFHDVEILLDGAARPWLFVACSTGLMKARWPELAWRPVERFENIGIPRISKAPVCGASAEVLLVEAHGWLHDWFPSGDLWRSRDGETWEKAAQPHVFWRRYFWLRADLFGPSQDTSLALVPVPSGELLLSSRGEQDWQLIRLAGGSGESDPLVALQRVAGEPCGKTLYGLTREGRWMALDLAARRWAELAVELPTAPIRDVAVPADAPEHVFAASRGQVHGSLDGGGTWRELPRAPEDAEALTVVPSPLYARDRTLFVGTSHGLYAVQASGAAWSKKKGLGDRRVLTVHVSRDFVTDATLYAGTDEGVFRSADAGATWGRMAEGMPAIPVNRIVAGPGGELYAATRFGVYGLDSEGRWRRLRNGLPPTNALALAADASPMLLVGTAEGAYRSLDGGASFERLRLPTGSASVTGLVVLGAPGAISIYAATVGGGFFSSADGGNSWSAMPTTESALQASCLARAGQAQLRLIAGTFNRGLWVYQRPP